VSRRHAQAVAARGSRFALPSIDRRTFVATDLYENMVPLIPAVGGLLEF
jgi:hypothetical protein